MKTTKQDLTRWESGGRALSQLKRQTNNCMVLKATTMTGLEEQGMPRDERWYVQLKFKSDSDRKLMLDSGASHHMVSLKDLTMEEQFTRREIGRHSPLRVATAVIWITEEVDIWIHELEIWVTACLSPHEETPCVLSLGKLFDETGCNLVWISKELHYLEIGNTIVYIYIARQCPFVCTLKQDDTQNPGGTGPTACCDSTRGSKAKSKSKS